MPEDFKIKVGVVGGKEAEAALKGVAGAEKAVGQAAAGAAPPLKEVAKAKTAAAETADELRMRDRTLLMEFARLTPECQVLAEAFQTIVTKTTDAGVALGVIGAAITAVTLVMRTLNTELADQRQRAERVRSALEGQRQAYLNMLAAAEKAEISPRRRGAPGAGEAAVKAGLALAPGVGGVGPADVEAAAEVAKAANRPLADDEMRDLMRFVAMGKTAGLKPRAAWSRFQRERQGGRMGPDFEKGWQKYAGTETYKAKTEAATLARAGAGEPAKRAKDYERIAQEMTLEGEAMTAQEAREALEGQGLEAEDIQLLSILTVLPRLQERLKRGYRGLKLSRYAEPSNRPGDVVSGQAGHITVQIENYRPGVQYHAPSADQAGQIPHNKMR